MMLVFRGTVRVQSGGHLVVPPGQFAVSNDLLVAGSGAFSLLGNAVLIIGGDLFLGTGSIISIPGSQINVSGCVNITGSFVTIGVSNSSNGGGFSIASSSRCFSGSPTLSVADAGSNCYSVQQSNPTGLALLFTFTPTPCLPAQANSAKHPRLGMGSHHPRNRFRPRRCFSRHRFRRACPPPPGVTVPRPQSARFQHYCNESRGNPKSALPRG